MCRIDCHSSHRTGTALNCFNSKKLICSECNAVSSCCFRRSTRMCGKARSHRSDVSQSACLFTLHLCIYPIKLILTEKLETRWRTLENCLASVTFALLSDAHCAPLCIFHFSFSASHAPNEWRSRTHCSIQSFLRQYSSSQSFLFAPLNAFVSC